MTQPAMGLADIARHVMGFHLTSETRDQNALDDEAGNICQAPPQCSGRRRMPSDASPLDPVPYPPCPSCTGAPAPPPTPDTPSIPATPGTPPSPAPAPDWPPLSAPAPDWPPPFAPAPDWLAPRSCQRKCESCSSPSASGVNSALPPPPPLPPDTGSPSCKPVSIAPSTRHISDAVSDSPSVGVSGPAGTFTDSRTKSPPPPPPPPPPSVAALTTR